LKFLYHHRTTAQDGSAVHIDGLVEALRELGVQVVMAAPAPARAGSVAPRGSALMSALRRRMPRWLHELAELAFNIPEAFALLRAVREQRPDLIYQRSNVYLLSGIWVARWMGVPLISEVNAPYFRERSLHGGIAWRALADWTERALWRRADATIVVTGVLADIVRSAGAAPTRVHVMPNGIDTRLFGSHAIDSSAKARLGLQGRTVLGFTGYVRDWNGLDAVLELLAAPEGRDCFLLVVGDGPARAALEAQATRLAVADRVRFTGVVARTEVAAHVAAFDIALQPAANPYASPLKLFEYMAMQRAIVAPDQPNIREILAHGRDAWLFEPGNPASFAAAILRLAAQPMLRAQVAQGAARTVQDRELTWTRNARRVTDLARALVRR
jgi:glycosyltransferase involved in cell wall biosynthesis